MYSMKLKYPDYKMPKVCCNCLKPADSVYEITTSTVKRKDFRTVTVYKRSLQVPLCPECATRYINNGNIVIMNVLGTLFFGIILFMLIMYVLGLLLDKLNIRDNINPTIIYGILAVVFIAIMGLTFHFISLDSKQAYGEKIPTFAEIKYADTDNPNFSETRILFKNLEFAKAFAALNNIYVITDTATNKGIQLWGITR